METSELRRGNYVSVRTSNVFMIDVIGKSHVEGITIESQFKDQMPNKYRSSEHDYHTDPIPLTEEWLNKFGFEYDSYTKCVNRNLFYISKDKDGFDINFHDNEYGLGEFSFHVQYVHQLQNAYFAIHQEELTIK